MSLALQYYSNKNFYYIKLLKLKAYTFYAASKIYLTIKNYLYEKF